MWAYLAKICIVIGTAPDQLTPTVYGDARRLIHDTVITVRGEPQDVSPAKFSAIDARERPILDVARADLSITTYAGPCSRTVGCA